MNDQSKPERTRIVVHLLLLLAGVVVLFYLCFAPNFFGLPVSFQARMIAVVVTILVFGFYLRRFGRKH